MSCEGCIYNTKKAGCDYSFPCNTTKKPIRKTEAVDDSTKRSKRKKTEVLHSATAIDV